MNAQDAIAGRVDIQLHSVGAELLRRAEGAWGVFVGDARGASMGDGGRAAGLSRRPSAIGRWLTSDGERPKGPITNYQWPITNCGACPLVLIRLLRLYPIIVLEDLPQCRPVFLRRRHRREIRREGLGRELIATHIAGFAGVDADAAVELEFRHVQMPVPI